MNNANRPNVLLADALAHHAFMSGRWSSVEQVHDGRFRHNVHAAGLLYQVEVKLLDQDNKVVTPGPFEGQYQLDYGPMLTYAQGPLGDLLQVEGDWYVYTIARAWDAATECINTATLAHIHFAMYGLPVEVRTALLVERRIYPIGVDTQQSLRALEQAA